MNGSRSYETVGTLTDLNDGDVATLTVAVPDTVPTGSRIFFRGFEQVAAGGGKGGLNIIGAVQGLRAENLGGGSWEIKMTVYVYSANPVTAPSPPYTQSYKLYYLWMNYVQ